MKQYSMNKAKEQLMYISKILENKEEDYVVISRNGKPLLKVTLFENNPRENLIGCAKGMFKVPDDFDDIDISSDFEEEIFAI